MVLVTLFAITMYGQYWRLYAVGQQIVNDIRVIRSCWSICSLCSESTTANLLLRLLTWNVYFASNTKHRPSLTYNIWRQCTLSVDAICVIAIPKSQPHLQSRNPRSAAYSSANFRATKTILGKQLINAITMATVSFDRTGSEDCVRWQSIRLPADYTSAIRSRKNVFCSFRSWHLQHEVV